MRNDASLTFVIGGARSGKSRHAESLAMAAPPPWTYVATAQAFDDEMAARIALHRQRRDERWRTLDAPLELPETLRKVEDGAPVLVDCLTLWLSNLMLRGDGLSEPVQALIGVLRTRRGPWVIVSNEVGSGIVPENALARQFRDEQGRLNQAVAAVADSVVLVVAGLPMRVK